ncbi:MAG: bifunctional UDP-N-acetylmuramoyl-L-alanyl-D-glutamate--2,6-diaminopimelate ligase MurE/UDP-N-acetylmuramoyl-tripeptide--D-alanyl-D-alanine ligase MurF [Gammaproteobacteria bacterium]|nr:bifunctional UDP-N-acetylmuramoyl-L-alanyl-D-glutamate--2,6-diaminopimelate ligase MurE/UDP-N-acetylmuramoyl-tripeptide--D-alanyl-D-alanine ligase MurF [Gammaproteobacteria bacterium]
MMAAHSATQAMRLSELLAGFVQLAPAMDREITGLRLDSRQIEAGELFCALPGSQADGKQYIDDAIKRGAAAVLLDADTTSIDQQIGVPYIAIPGLRSMLGAIAARFYGEPSQQMSMIGITGTNGKTSVSRFLAQALSVDAPCGVIGTLGNGLLGAESVSSHTTPDAISLQAMLAQMQAQGAATVSMEVSSHGLDQGRVNGVAFDTVVFTNLSRDHLDYHGDMDAYAAAKARLFHWQGLSHAVINLDDDYGDALLAGLDNTVRAVAYGTQAKEIQASTQWVWASSVQASATGFEVNVDSSWGQGSFHLGLLGNFNVSNALAVLATLLVRGMELDAAMARMQKLSAVAGRMQTFGGHQQPLVVVDYAHTPDALEQVLGSLRSHCHGQLWVVFGCGGDRDQGKRAEMGRIATQCADKVVITTDNPRSENPADIAQAILTGSGPGAQIQLDRREAIRYAINNAQADDVIVVAGKGHEDYQLIGAERLPFDDRDVVAQILDQAEEAGAEKTKSGIGMRLSELATEINGQLYGADITFHGVSTDTRNIAPGSLFVALRGERFDAHHFLAQAKDQGAAAVMVDTAAELALPQLVVDDTRLGLGRLAAAWRNRFALPLVAVTGSNGKTTVKEMLASILAAKGDEVLATNGNFNNDIGMPLTLLRLQSEHKAAVIEMGANHHGEIAYLTHIARPTVALITNAGQAHLEGFGSVEGVSRAKGEIYAGLTEDGTAVINADDDYAPYWLSLNNGRKQISFGLNVKADVSADIDVGDAEQSLSLHTPLGNCEVRLQLPGRHNVMNALAAAAAAIAAGADLAMLKQGLESVSSVQGRLKLCRGLNDSLVIDDTYNANPSSLAVGLEVLTARTGKRVLVLGDMGELGPDAESIHTEMGELALKMGVDALYCTGELSRKAAQSFGHMAVHFDSKETLIGSLKEQVSEELTLLVKGSRRMRMEEVVAALTTDGEVNE